MRDRFPYSILQKCRTTKPIIKEFLAEFIGTFILILMGSGAAAINTLKGTGSTSDMFASGYGLGLGLFLGVLVSASISGGNLNPIVTIAFASVNKLKWRKVPVYLLAQYLAGFTASAIVYSNYYESITAYDSGMNRTAQILTTFPSPGITLGGVFLDQTICGGILMFAIMALIDTNNLNVPQTSVPILIGLTLCAINISFGLNCGAALNPARDLSGRIFLSMVGPLNSIYWLIGGVIGPHFGAIVGAFIYLFFIELHHDLTPNNN